MPYLGLVSLLSARHNLHRVLAGALARIKYSRTGKAFSHLLFSKFPNSWALAWFQDCPQVQRAFQKNVMGFKHAPCQNESDLKKLTSFVVSFTAALQLSILVQHKRKVRWQLLLCFSALGFLSVNGWGSQMTTRRKILVPLLREKSGLLVAVYFDHCMKLRPISESMLDQ